MWMIIKIIRAIFSDLPCCASPKSTLCTFPSLFYPWWTFFIISISGRLLALQMMKKSFSNYFFLWGQSQSRSALDHPCHQWLGMGYVRLPGLLLAPNRQGFFSSHRNPALANMLSFWVSCPKLHSFCALLCLTIIKKSYLNFSFFILLPLPPSLTQYTTFSKYLPPFPFFFSFKNLLFAMTTTFCQQPQD